jgi:hypothetical protein
VGIIATGGVETEISVGGVDYVVHTFLSSDDFVVHAPVEVEYLIVGGGGGGGAGTGGGGGAGGMRTGTVSATVQTYPVAVGLGGQGGVGRSVNPASGQASSALGVSATGGGYGAQDPDPTWRRAGAAGGSGGGGANWYGTPQAPGAGTSGQGNSGGAAPTSEGGGGGGGGAGGVGEAYTGGTTGLGGIGALSSITGTATYYAGGGSGDRVSASALGGGGGRGEGGTPNTGGGGGGALLHASGVSGAGGSGIVVIRYVAPPRPPERIGDGTGLFLVVGRQLDPDSGVVSLRLRKLEAGVLLAPVGVATSSSTTTETDDTINLNTTHRIDTSGGLPGLDFAPGWVVKVFHVGTATFEEAEILSVTADKLILTDGLSAALAAGDLVYPARLAGDASARGYRPRDCAFQVADNGVIDDGDETADGTRWG